VLCDALQLQNQRKVSSVLNSKCSCEETYMVCLKTPNGHSAQQRRLQLGSALITISGLITRSHALQARTYTKGNGQPAGCPFG
jgi:hypothetical protein